MMEDGSRISRGELEVRARAAAVEAEQLSVTIITVEEILTGSYSQIRCAKNDLIPSDGMDKNLQIVTA